MVKIKDLDQHFKIRPMKNETIIKFGYKVIGEEDDSFVMQKNL